MTPSGFQSLMTALIRIGLLLALVILLMAENAHAQPVAAQLTCGYARIAFDRHPRRFRKLTAYPIFGISERIRLHRPRQGQHCSRSDEETV